MPAPETILYQNPLKGGYHTTKTDKLVSALELAKIWEMIDGEDATLNQLEQSVDYAIQQMRHWREEQNNEEDSEAKRKASSAAASLCKRLLDDAKFAADKKRNEDFIETYGDIRLALPTDPVPSLAEMREANREQEKYAGSGTKIKMCINDCGNPIDPLEVETTKPQLNLFFGEETEMRLAYNIREHAGKLDCETCEKYGIETEIEASASWWYCPHPCPVCQKMMKQYSVEPPTYNDMPTPCSIECADYLKEHYKTCTKEELMYSNRDIMCDD